MPYTCIVIGCKSRGTMPDKRFYRFPMLNSRSSNALAKSKARQLAWLDVIRKPNFLPSNYKNAKVCNLHFISGQSAKLYDVENPDWVPNQNMGYERVRYERDPLAMSAENKINLQTEEKKNPEVLCSTNMSPKEIDFLELPEAMREQRDSNDCGTRTVWLSRSIATQTEAKLTGMSSEVILSLREKIRFLEAMLSTHLVKMESFDENDRE